MGTARRGVRWGLGAGGTFFLTLALAGCGGGETPVPDSEDPGAARTDAAPAPGSAPTGAAVPAPGPAPAESARLDGAVYVDPNTGRKWLGKIPYDVFFGDPLAVAANKDPVGTAVATAPGDGVASAAPAGSGTSGTPVATGPKPAAGPALPPWKDLISAETIDSEVKRIMSRTAGKIVNIGQYNSSYLELPPHLGMLAALGAVGTEYEDELRWKANAKHVRDQAASMMKEPLKRDPKSFKQVKDPHDRIAEILAGSPPAGLPEAADATDFAAAVDMGLLMKRIEIGSKWLKTNAGTEESFKSQAEDAKHEAQLLAMAARMIQTEGYGYSDDKAFRGLATSMLDGSRTMTDALSAGSFAKFDEGLSKVYKACTECHTAYRQ